MNKHQSLNSASRGIKGIYAGLLLTCVLLLIISLSLVIQQGINKGEDDFRQYTHQLQQSISSGLAINETILDGFAAFLADVGMQDPNRARFYTRTMLTRYPHLYMFQAAQRINNSEVIEFEKNIAEQSGQNIKVRQFVFNKGLIEVDLLTPRDFYPVVFVEPTFSDGVDILGLDITSIEFIKGAMQRAFTTGLASLSQMLELSDGSEAFVMIKPSVLPGQTIPDQYALIIVKVNSLIMGHAPEEQGYQFIVKYGDAEPLVNIKTAELSSLENVMFPLLTLDEHIEVGGDKLHIMVKKQFGFQQINMYMVLLVIFIFLVVCLVIYLYRKMHLEAEKIKRQAEVKLYQQANYDRLTGLANRHYFEDYITKAISRDKRQRNSMAILYLDLNDFKKTNDELGHHVGDALLIETSKCISNVIRSEDLASRFGGDEFVLLLDLIKNESDVNRVISRLQKQFSMVNYLEGHNVTLSASIGCAIFPRDGETLASLLKVADKNMYNKKRELKNNVVSINEKSDGI